MFRSTSTGPSKSANSLAAQNSTSKSKEKNNSTTEDSNNAEGLKEMRRSHLRRAVTDVQVPTLTYFQVFQNNSTSRVEAPPPYDEALDLPLPPARFKVAPREEEGRENLPQYSCSIRREAVFERKVELESPFERAYDRKWSKVYVVLNNTMLNIHKPKRVISAGKNPLDEEITYAPGSVIKSYTLQHTEVGAATDYKKKEYVIRIRAETHQFLLSCDTVDIFMDWLEALSSGIDLSLPLEERSLPKYQTIPRRRRRRRAAEVVQQQEEIIRQHFPHLLSDEQRERLAPTSSTASSPTTAQRPTTSRGSDSVEESANVPDIEDSTRPDLVDSPEDAGYGLQEIQELSLEPSNDNNDTIERRPSTADPVIGASTSVSGSPNSSRPSSSGRHIAELVVNRPTTANATTDRDGGKWRPGSRVTREAQLRFARRCMSVLTADAPRQSDYVMHSGTRYRLDYEMRTMIREGASEKRPGTSTSGGLRSLVRA